MTTKLKIDLTQGILEVEGSEVFVKSIYRDFKLQFLGEEAVEEEVKPARRRRGRKSKKAPQITLGPKPAAKAGAEPAEAAEPVDEAKVPIPASTHTYLKDLDLSASPDHPSLVEFMDAKFPITNEERNLVFLYYLQKVINQKPVTADHVYSCYRKVNIRAPLNLDHNLQVTADHHGWIRIAKSGNLAVTAEGKRYAENELPKRVKN